MRVAEQVAVRLRAVAAGDGDVELGVAPHAVLADVEAGRLGLLLDADPPEALHRPEARERRAEGEGADRGEPEQLHPDLVQRAGVDETALAGVERRSQRWDCEEPGRDRAPDAGDAVDRDRADRIVDPDPLDRKHADDRNHARDEADHNRGPGRDEPACGGDGHERREDAVQHHRDVRLAQHEPGRDRAADRAGRGREVRRQRDVREEADAVAGDDAERRAGVEPEPAEPEDDRPQHGVGDVVAGDRVPAAALKLADPRAQEQRARQCGKRALVVDHGRAGEVLHPEPEEPAAAPDPVRGDGVDQGERGSEDEVDPELRTLGHRAPDDRQRDAGEDDLEQVAGRARDGREEGVRRLADREQRVHRGHEAAGADDRVAVAERDSEADRPVDQRADAEDQHVLARDVRGVLHPRQARLEEGEAGLHEHHEHGRDDDPERVRREEEVGVLHAASSARRSGRPVRLWVTWSTGVVQTRPSPQSFPLRAASAAVAATAAASSSATTNVSSAFGRKRDSKTRPRYSCVIPRCRPWPTASTTVTPTWPVCSSTASITISTRSRRTTASTFLISPPSLPDRARDCPRAWPRGAGVDEKLQFWHTFQVTTSLRRSSRTTSRQTPCRRPIRSWVPTTRKPKRRSSARLAAFSGKTPVCSVQIPARSELAISAASSSRPTPWPRASSPMYTLSAATPA